MSLATIALLTGEPVYYLLASIGVAIVAVSFALPPLLVARLGARRVLPRAIHAGQPFPVRVALSNGKRLLPAVDLAVVEVGPRRGVRDAPGAYVPIVPPGGTVEVEFWARPRARGVYRMDGISVASSFPFGLGEKRVRFETPGDFYVYPAIGRFRADFLGDGDGDVRRPTPAAATASLEFLDLRRFRPGDNPRHIHWKVSARRGERMIRQFARRSAERRVVALDVVAPRGGRAAAFEKAVSLAATLCHRLAEAGCPLALAIGGEPPRLVRLGGASARSFLAPLAEVRPERSGDAGSLIESLPPADLLLVVTARPPAEVEAEIPASTRRSRAIRVLSATAPGIERWFMVPRSRPVEEP